MAWASAREGEGKGGWRPARTPARKAPSCFQNPALKRRSSASGSSTSGSRPRRASSVLPRPPREVARAPTPAHLEAVPPGGHPVHRRPPAGPGGEAQQGGERIREGALHRLLSGEHLRHLAPEEAQQVEGVDPVGVGPAASTSGGNSPAEHGPGPRGPPRSPSPGGPGPAGAPARPGGWSRSGGSGPPRPRSPGAAGARPGGPSPPRRSRGASRRMWAARPRGRPRRRR